MITEDKIAAAQIAQIFGGELLRVENNVMDKSSQTPSAVRVDPRSILTGQHRPQHDQITLQRQQEADAMQPSTLEDSAFRQANQVVNLSPPQQINPIAQLIPHGNASTPTHFAQNNQVFENINKNLERIADRLDSLDIVVRKRRIRALTNNETSSI